MSSVAEKVCAEVAALRGCAVPVGTTLQAVRLLNWGGFVNHSFRVSAGERALHVKLADDPETLRGLLRWRHLSSTLTRRYGAPEMLGWIELPSPALAGPVFEWIEGASPETLGEPVRAAAAARVADLHRDAGLAAQLRAQGDTVRSCAAAYQATFHDRFVADLEGIRAAPPPFVTPSLLDWMADEAGSLASHVAGSPAFRMPADAPTHQDLWLDNLIVTPVGAVHILDWDGLGLGDPMMDWAMLLGPTRRAVGPADPAHLPDLPFPAAAVERFGLHARASLLDWIIDPLADWVEAGGSEHRDTVREAKRETHERALSAYRDRYP